MYRIYNIPDQEFLVIVVIWEISTSGQNRVHWQKKTFIDFQTLMSLFVTFR